MKLIIAIFLSLLVGGMSIFYVLGAASEHLNKYINSEYQDESFLFEFGFAYMPAALLTFIGSYYSLWGDAVLSFFSFFVIFWLVSFVFIRIMAIRISRNTKLRKILLTHF